MAGKQEFPAYLSIDVPWSLARWMPFMRRPTPRTPQSFFIFRTPTPITRAQMKIKKLLDYMNRKLWDSRPSSWKAPLEKLNADYLRLFSGTRNATSNFCDELAKQGELTGASFILWKPTRISKP